MYVQLFILYLPVFFFVLIYDFNTLLFNHYMYTRTTRKIVPKVRMVEQVQGRYCCLCGKKFQFIVIYLMV